MSALLRAVNKISYALFLQLYFLIRLPFPLMVLQLLFSLFLFDPKCSRNGNHLTTWDILYKAHHMVSCMPLDSVQLITGQGKAEQISLICISIKFFVFGDFFFFVVLSVVSLGWLVVGDVLMMCWLVCLCVLET